MIFTQQWRPWSLVFFLFLATSPAWARPAITVQKVQQLQFAIGGEEERARPVLSWTGSPDLLVVDMKTLFFWKKKKLLQLVYSDDSSQSPCSVVLSPSGARFAASLEGRSLMVGSIDGMQTRQVRDEQGFDKLIWKSNDLDFYYTRNKTLYSFFYERFYSESLIDGVNDFMLNHDESRILAKTSKGEDVLMNSDGSVKGVFPASAMVYERRGTIPFIKNITADFRKFIAERKGPQAKGFLLYRNNWRNRPAEKKPILEDFRGNGDAAFSPDMTRIALSVKDSGGQSFMVILSASGDILVKSAPQKNWIYQNPLWSPQSDWIVWNYIDLSRPEGDRSRYFISDARGVGLQFIQQSLSSSEFYWSPRSDRLVVRLADKAFQSGRYVIYDVKERRFQEIFNDTRIRATSRPVWSPDGRYVGIIDYTNFQKREKRIEIVQGEKRERECVFFREQVFLFNPGENTLLLAW